MLIAEDLALLLFDDDALAPVSGAANLEYSLAGALLIELAVRDRIDVAPGALADTAPGALADTAGQTGGDGGARAEGPGPEALVVLDAESTGISVLDGALTTVAERAGAKPTDALGALAGRTPSAELLAGLADRGILRRADGRIAGRAPTEDWAEQDLEHGRHVRAELHRVLVEGGEPDERTTALIALLTGTDTVARVLGAEADPAEVKRRADRIAEGNRARDALREPVEKITAAVVAALFVPTLVTPPTP
ncbi:GOLPH3/VPS74 family protein [Saccharomonospora saliphila]|uniref:GOLPH3/VPS74 family protein n=1 Tax=Saccharomonospora saliphila TaxID=369829 RepID=UPI00037FD11E|nr:GPP34 family phosphoprotein [Saccharomonospora saliphila]